MSLKYKVGDIVVLGDVEEDFNRYFYQGVHVKIEQLCEEAPEPHYTVVVDVDGEEKFWWVEDHEINHTATAALNGVEQVPQTSNEKAPFVSFFTSVIVAKNKAVSDIGEMLYDENTTKIYLEDEGGGAFLIVEQDYNGAIQQIRLDIDEVDAVFSAIKQLVSQMEGK